jgi:hypothetical protein
LETLSQGWLFDRCPSGQSKVRCKHANKNHSGLYGLQTEKLQYYKRKKEPSRQNGDKETLQILREAHITQGDALTALRGYY